MFDHLNEKDRSKLGRLWNKVLDPKGYLVAESMDEYKQLSDRHGIFPFIMESRIHAFATDETKHAFQELVSNIRFHAGKEIFSWKAVHEAIKNRLIRALVYGEHAKAGQMIKEVAASLQETVHPHKLLLPITGIELMHCVIENQNWKIKHCNEDEINKFSSNLSEDSNWKDHVNKILSDEYNNRAFFEINLIGEIEQAADNAFFQLKYILNTLRYAALMHAENHYNARTVRIEINASSSSRKGRMLNLREDTGSVGFRSVPGESARPFKITKENLDAYCQNFRLHDLWNLYVQEEKSDLEAAIIDAVTWIGEAQNDNYAHIAFIKYWTSLEALVTGYQKNEITDRLKTALPILLSQIIGKNPPSKNAVCKMYSLRSDMLHGRGLTDINYSDLCTVSSWASDCLFVCLELRSRGYNTRASVFEQSDRMSKRKLQ